MASGNTGIYRRGRRRPRWWLCLFLPLIPLLWGGYQAASILYLWKTAEPVKAPVAVILGAAVWDGQPSPALRERLDIAVELYENGWTTRFLCTGGTPGGEPPEASVCAQYLTAHGVPARAIIQETESRSTWENLTNARKILGQEGVDEILLVTHGFHLKRALMQARDLGFVAHGAPVRIRPVNLSTYVAREVLAIGFYQLGGRDSNGVGGLVQAWLDRLGLN
jgi:uncharacterized SAM-binding protein YcdF (DUF218 family)